MRAHARKTEGALITRRSPAPAKLGKVDRRAAPRRKGLPGYAGRMQLKASDNSQSATHVSSQLAIVYGPRNRVIIVMVLLGKIVDVAERS